MEHSEREELEQLRAFRRQATAQIEAVQQKLRETEQKLQEEISKRNPSTNQQRARQY